MKLLLPLTREELLALHASVQVALHHVQRSRHFKGRAELIEQMPQLLEARDVLEAVIYRTTPKA